MNKVRGFLQLVFSAILCTLEVQKVRQFGNSDLRPTMMMTKCMDISVMYEQSSKIQDVLTKKLVPIRSRLGFSVADTHVHVRASRTR
jgi:hypothetical protein